jgi:hypothetical protein
MNRDWEIVGIIIFECGNYKYHFSGDPCEGFAIPGISFERKFSFYLLFSRYEPSQGFQYTTILEQLF